MEIRITIIEDGKDSRNLVPIVSGPHNVHYSYAEKNHLFFRVLRYPAKKIADALRRRERKDFKITGCFIRACFKLQGVSLCFVVRYNTKTDSGKKNRYTVDEKEAVFVIEADKEEVVQFVEPFSWHIREANNERSADTLLKWFDEWAHPLTLEAVTKNLTEAQKFKAAQILNAYFSD